MKLKAPVSGKYFTTDLISTLFVAQRFIAQTLLIHRGYDCGGRKFLGRETPDGDFGPATEKAVRSFQTKTSLESDDEVGADTWTALLTAV